MGSLDQVRHGLNRLWDNLTEGWQHLRDRASNAMTRFSPLRSSSELETAEERFIHNASPWGLLTAELSEDDKQIKVRLEAPGMEADDFDLSVVDDHLLIRGEKKVQREQSEGRYYMMECAYGRFERALPLPAPVDEDKARATYKRGVLSITLPKLQAGATRRIAVKG